MEKSAFSMFFCVGVKMITASDSYESKAITYMIRGKMMSIFVFSCPQLIYKYILAYSTKKVNKMQHKF